MEFPEGFKRKEYIAVWYSDLARFASKHFGCEIEMHGVLDFPNQDTYFTMPVPSDREWEYVWDENLLTYVTAPERGNEIRAELAGKVTDALTLDILLDLLYDDGVIPSGEYLVTVWW